MSVRKDPLDRLARREADLLEKRADFETGNGTCSTRDAKPPREFGLGRPDSGRFQRMNRGISR